MHPVCNNTKWEELRKVMIELPDGRKPAWRTKALNGYIYGWDGDWTYHFKLGDHKDIEWCEIRSDQHNSVEQLLKSISSISMSGEVFGSIIRIYGYVQDTGTEAHMKFISGIIRLVLGFAVIVMAFYVYLSNLTQMASNRPVTIEILGNQVEASTDNVAIAIIALGSIGFLILATGIVTMLRKTAAKTPDPEVKA
jgi:hypothetical protein